MNQELSDEKMIWQAKKTFPGEVEPLYWILEDAIDSNEISKAKGIYDMFLYMAKYQQDVLAKGLKKTQLGRLKQIAFELYDNKIIRNQEPVIIKQAIAPKKLPFEKELDLEKYLLENTCVLEDALQDKIFKIDSQVETNFEYRCDLVAENSVKFYPIELKIYQANHQVVSQIRKYCWFFYRELRYARYRDIQGVIIANGFDSWSINELRRDGIWAFQINASKGNNITLHRVQ